MNGPRVGFTGSREYARPDLVENFVRSLANKYPDAVVISGGRGKVDETAENTGVACGLEVISFRPTKVGSIYTARLWTNVVNGKIGELYMTPIDCGTDTSFARACFSRNGLIVKSAEKVVGFWDLRSRGTADTLSRARGARKTPTVYGPEGEGLTEQQVIAQIGRVLG